MGKAKLLRIAPISAVDARRVIRALHYSGKVVNNSQIHLGVFLDGRYGGAMSFGPSMDKRKIQGLVRDTPWNGFIELNRMAFADWLPRNGESRSIGIALRWLKETYKNLQWVISFADATQCGDGTIYRASGFYLTGIKRNNQIWTHEDHGDDVFSRMSLTDQGSTGIKKQAERILAHVVTKGKHCAASNGAASMRRFKDAGFIPLSGFQLRYVYFLDPTARVRLTVPEIPFSEIARRGATMYKGKQGLRAGSIASDAPDDQSG